MLSNKINIRLEEREAIDLLVNSKDSMGFADLRAFYNVLYDPIPNEDYWKYKGFFVAKNVLRKELGFLGDSKPGDFDVIIIPFTPDRVYFERTAVFEVKIVRPTRMNPGRNANSLGITQVNGLIKDGFPFVALLHICMTEPLVEEEKDDVDYIREPIKIDGDPEGLRKYQERIKIKADFFSGRSTDNQIRRLLATDLPKFVGINAQGLNYYEDGKKGLASCSQDYWHFLSGYFNPYTLKQTIEKVEAHFNHFRHKYEDKVIR